MKLIIITNYRSVFGSICINSLFKNKINFVPYILDNNPYKIPKNNSGLSFLSKIKSFFRKKDNCSYLEFNDNTIKYCDFLGIRFKSIDSINEVIFNDILLYNPDAVILADAPIISKKCVNMLNDAKIKIFNMHAADLPKYRGNYATYAMVRDNLPLVITLHTVDEKIDKGIVIDKFKLEKQYARDNDTFFSLERKLYVNGIDYFVKNIRKYILGSYNHLYVNDNDYPLVSVTQKERNDIKKNFSNYLFNAYGVHKNTYDPSEGVLKNVNVDDHTNLFDLVSRINLLFEDNIVGDDKKKFGLFHCNSSEVYTDYKIDKINKKILYLPNDKSWSVILSHDVDIIPDDFSSVKPIFDLENKYSVNSTFLLAAQESYEKRHRYDPTYLLDEPLTKELIYYIVANNHEIGLHGSYNSYNNYELLMNEKDRLETFIGMEVKSIRQHYLNFHRLITPTIQEESGFVIDSSIGFPSDFGLRSSMSKPYYMFDYKNTRNHNILMLPYLIMDQNIFFNERLENSSYDQKLKYFIERIDYARRNNSVVVLDWHVHTIEMDGWWKIYEDILKYVTSDNSCFVTTMENFYYTYKTLNN